MLGPGRAATPRELLHTPSALVRYGVAQAFIDARSRAEIDHGYEQDNVCEAVSVERATTKWMHKPTGLDGPDWAIRVSMMLLVAQLILALVSLPVQLKLQLKESKEPPTQRGKEGREKTAWIPLMRRSSPPVCSVASRARRKASRL